MRTGMLLTSCCSALLACGGSTEPSAVRLDIVGTVRVEGTQTSVAGAKVILADRRTSIDAGYVLASATTSSSGGYQLSAEAKRPGYVPGCDFLLVFVEGYEYIPGGRTVTCTSQRQVIDLAVAQGP